MRRLSVLLALLLSACATIPTTSPVEVVASLPAEVAPGGVRVVVRPPAEGMNAVQAAQGFLAANAAQSGDYEVARQYLTTSAAADWQPRRVDIYEPTSFEVTELDSDTVTVRYSVIGQLDAADRLSLNDSATTRELTLELVQSRQGWRVTNPLSAALMTLSDFSRNFAGYKLWFLNTDYDLLSPDFVWLPAGSAATPTRLARRLLDGPQGPLTASLRTAVPADTRLAIGAVTVEDGTAKVVLTNSALAAVGAQRTALLAQLTFTLAQVASDVEVLVGSQPLTQAGRNLLEPELFDNLDVSASKLSAPLFSVADGVVRRGERREWRPLWRLFGSVSISANWDGRLLAATRGDSVRVYQAASGALVLTGPNQVVDLAFDRSSRLWLARSDGSISLLEPSGAVRQVFGLLPNEPVTALSPSPDGTRLAVIAATSSGPMLRVYPIVVNGTQVGLAAPMRVERQFSEVLDADWNSAAELVVLARARTELAEVYLVDQSSLAPTLLVGMSRASYVTAKPGQPPCAVSAGSVLFCRVGAEWREFGLSTAADYAG